MGIFDWAGKEKEKKRLLEEADWKKENITPEVMTVLNECSYGFNVFAGTYGSDAVLINIILKLEKKVKELEELVKNDN